MKKFIKISIIMFIIIIISSFSFANYIPIEYIGDEKENIETAESNSFIVEGISIILISLGAMGLTLYECYRNKDMKQKNKIIIISFVGILVIIGIILGIKVLIK